MYNMYGIMAVDIANKQTGYEFNEADQNSYNISISTICFVPLHVSVRGTPSGVNK
jgi:hypothetical protein